MRLIDADNLIPIMKYTTTDNEIGVFPIRIGFNTIKRVIDEAPTIDAVEVVRCKDCKHWHEWENATGSCLRSENGCNWFGTDAIDYCSFGERKNDSE